MLKVVVAEWGGQELDRFPIDIDQDYPQARAVRDEDFFAVAKWFLINRGVRRATVEAAVFRFVE